MGLFDQIAAQATKTATAPIRGLRANVMSAPQNIISAATRGLATNINSAAQGIARVQENIIKGGTQTVGVMAFGGDVPTHGGSVFGNIVGPSGLVIPSGQSLIGSMPSNPLAAAGAPIVNALAAGVPQALSGGSLDLTANTATRLRGGLSARRAREIYDQMRQMHRARSNIWTLEVSDYATAAGATAYENPESLFNFFAIEVSYSLLNVEGDRIRVGAAEFDTPNASVHTDFRVTTYDDEMGTLQRWFAAKSAQAVRNDGTVGLPIDYLIRFKVIHQFIDIGRPVPPQVKVDTLLVRAGSMEIDLNRAEQDFQRVTMVFTQADTSLATFKQS